MRPDKIKVYALEILLLAILAFTLFVSKVYSRILVACLLTVCAIATSIFLKKRNIQTRNSSKANIIMTIFAIIYLVGFYLMGLYFGYYKPVLTFSYLVVIQFIIPVAIIIVASEMMRNILLAQNTKFTKLLTFLSMVIIDLLIYTNIYSAHSYDQIIEVIGFGIFAAIACNLLYNYVAVRYGFVGNIIFRLITVLYAYIIPIIPNVFIFFRSILRVLYPYVMYHVFEYAFSKERKAVPAHIRKGGFVGKVILFCIIGVMAMIISCNFTIGALVIGSGSMTGTINKGDAVIFEKYSEQDDIIEEGDIIIFIKQNVKVVHRVIEKKVVNGQTRYITKGDANQQADAGYITNSDIYATTKFRIPYIGYPSIWIRDILSK